MAIGVCKFCGQEKQLIDSHIIPKCLYKLEKTGSLVEVDVQKKRIDRNPSGQNGYKERLMCAECDNKLGVLDNYAHKILNNIIPELPIQNVNGINGQFLSATEFDIQKFRKFFISILWRLSVASGGTNLGKYQDIALEVLKGEIPDNPDLFLPLIYKKSTGNPVIDEASSAGGAKYLGKHFVEFRFPGYLVMIIINTKHSQNDNLMKLHKEHFNENGVWVYEYNLISPRDKQLMSGFLKCQKAFLATNPKRPKNLQPQKNAIKNQF